MPIAFRFLIGLGVMFLVALTVLAQVPSTINDFFLPGSQPNQSGSFERPTKCDNCHGGYAVAFEPAFNWRGSMMAQAARDPLFYACVTIANQDAPESGDLCLRCHTPTGWLEGRSVPTDGTALNSDDREGVHCDFCHRLVKPTDLGVNPYPADADYTSGTYPADSTYLASIDSLPPNSANGMFIVDDDNTKRGPFTDPVARHQFYYSPFHRESAICGTCHDVSNPAHSLVSPGDYAPNAFDEAAPDFNLRTMFPIERTYSEWLISAYNTPDGVFAPQFGGNKDTVRSCQDCHMRDVTGEGCNKPDSPTRTDLPLHDLTGGNTFIPLTIEPVFPGETDPLALDSGLARAETMLQKAATMEVSVTESGNDFDVLVRVTNETGHKLPSGYPEGRRIWLSVTAYNSADQVIYESGAYDAVTAVLTHDADIKVYEIKPGISGSLSPAVGFPVGPSFHFVINDTVFKDNRIPPRGTTNIALDSIQSPVVDYAYADGQYWDETPYTIPGSSARLEVTLRYQTTSKEYVEFLRDENTTNSWGDTLYNLWSTYGKSQPVAMNTYDSTLTPLATNNPPVLAAIGPQTTDENQLLTFIVTASDLDGDSLVLSATGLPAGATYTDHFNDSATFSWTPTYDQAGDYDVTFYARDIENAVDSEVVTISVANVNRPPTLASIGAQNTNENELLTFVVTASDLDGDSLVLSATGLPAGATYTDHFNDSATFSWTPAYDQAGDHDVTFFVHDIENAVDSEVVTITVANMNRPPSLASIGSKSTNEGELLSFIVTATDLDNDSLVLLAENLPTGASFTDHFNDSATFAWTPDPGQAGDYTVRFIVRDELLAADSEEVGVTVTVSNGPPVLASIGAQNVNENQLLTIIVSATDPNTDSIILSAAGLPTGATFTDHFNDSATFAWTPTYDQSGNYDVTFYARDEFSAVDSEVVSIAVANVNRPPDITAGDDLTVAVGETVNIHAVATDPDNESLDISVRVLPDGADFTDHGDGTADFAWIPASDQVGDHNLVFDVTDGVATDSAVVLLSVTDVCCVGRTGDVDQIGTFPTEIDSSDLGALVSFLFSPPGTVTLPCPEEADVDALAGPNPVDSSDLGALVSFLFSPPGTVTLPDCP